MWQPVHAVYGGAHLFKQDIAAKLGRVALKVLREHRAAFPASDEVTALVERKLERNPVEDYRIDFEDGYGYRSDEEEDAHAAQAAKEVAEGYANGNLPPMLGIRIKPLTPESRRRSLRTLQLFFGELLERAGRCPENFAVTLPKSTSEEQPLALLEALAELRIQPAVELMVETPQMLRRLRPIVDACRGRVRGANFGPYDFSSGCGIAGTAQGLRHPLCTHARNVMLIELAGSGIWLSDGPTNVLPIGDRETVREAWQTQLEDVRHSLHSGFYQGWDLHPGQIALRYAAVFGFFREALPDATKRFRNFLDQKAQATRVGSAFDDAATANGLRVFLLRAVACGALGEAELRVGVGVGVKELEELRF